MGPPSFNGGRWRQRLISAAIRATLQWGLRLSTEEGRASNRPLSESHVLQWGLRLSTEEGRCPRVLEARRPRGFNGASVFQRRKGRLTPCSFTPGVSFNGASVFQRRKARFSTWISTATNCFNGASVFQRRKVDGWPAGVFRLARLQWGLRLSTEEGCHVGASLLGIDRASMGPPSFNGGRWVGGGRVSPRRMASMGPPSFNGGRGKPAGNRL